MVLRTRRWESGADAAATWAGAWAYRTKYLSGPCPAHSERTVWVRSMSAKPDGTLHGRTSSATRCLPATWPWFGPAACRYPRLGKAAPIGPLRLIWWWRSLPRPSPDQTWLKRRCIGSRVVLPQQSGWIWPVQRELDLWTAGIPEPHTLRGDDTLEGGDIVPGFLLPLDQLW